MTVKGLDNRTKSISNYLNVDYNLYNRYFVSAAVAMDASSRFGNDTKGGVNLLGKSWGMFPSLNASWIASAESFMKSLDFISFLKFKAGYGITGNDGILDNDAMAYFAYMRFIGRANGIVIANLENLRVFYRINRQ